jgi:hypothetical protein
VGGVIRHHIAEAVRRYDPRLFLRYGLHPNDVRRIALGIEVPYAKRRFCYSLYRKTKHGDVQLVFPYTDTAGNALPLDQRLISRIRDADLRRWFPNDKIHPLKWDQYLKQHLGEKSADEHDAEALSKWEDKFKGEGADQIRFLMKKQLRAHY